MNYLFYPSKIEIELTIYTVYKNDNKKKNPGI